MRYASDFDTQANADGNEVIRETKRLRIRNQQRRDGGHIFFTSLLLLYDVDYDDDKRYRCHVVSMRNSCYVLFVCFCLYESFEVVSFIYFCV